MFKVSYYNSNIMFSFCLSPTVLGYVPISQVAPTLAVFARVLTSNYIVCLHCDLKGRDITLSMCALKRGVYNK